MSENTLFKEYIRREEVDLKVEVYYQLGGWNFFSGNKETRGYYLSITPVNIERYEDNSIKTVTATAFSGVKTLLKEVTRRSKKAGKEALSLAEEEKERLIKHVLVKNAV